MFLDYSRGSVWRKCDFHIHTPFSALGNEFGSDFDVYVQTLFKKAIEKRIEVIGITDYFTIDGYKKIKIDYLENTEKLKTLFSIEEIAEISKILVLPNVEFRLNKIIQINKTRGAETKTENGRINFHVIFSDQVPIKAIEENFLHDIDFVYEADPDQKDKRKKLKVDNLITLGSRLKREQPDIHGSDLEIGMINAVVNDEEIADLLAMNNDFKDKYLIVIPSDEDLSEINWRSQDGLTRKILISRSHALLSSNPNTIKFGLGEKSENIEEFINEFKSLKPCVWGSDAHGYPGIFEPDKERYCWIKADSTFEGIRQILHEPADRIFIGKYPAIYERVKSSRNYYIDSLTINKVQNYEGSKGIWFNDFKLNFGFELIALIGNKGKGKSAIADIVGLLGNAHVEKKDFSFLNNDKFCQKGYSENFVGALKWFDGSINEKHLNENVDYLNVERVKYIPQSYLEKLCNNEDGGFKEEINKVVFSRLDESDKLGKSSFSELEKFKTQLINQNLDELKLKLTAVNRIIDTLEGKNNEMFKKSVENKLGAKRLDLANHEKDKESIKPVPNPETDPSFSKDQREMAEKLSVINTQIVGLEGLIEIENKNLNSAKISLTELTLIRDEIISTSERFEAWKKGRAESYGKHNLDINDLINLTYNTKKIEDLIKLEEAKIGRSNILLSKESVRISGQAEQSLIVQVDLLNIEKTSIEKELEKPFKDWQEYQKIIKEWESRKKAIIGSEDVDESLKYYENQLNYLSTHLQSDIDKNRQLRLTIVRDVYVLKQQVQSVYQKMKVAISEILKEYSEGQRITIETSFKVERAFFSKFFDYVNRYGAFYQIGDDELRRMMHSYDFDNIEQVLEYLNKLFSLEIHFKAGRELEFYDFICSLEYLRPEYDLRLNGKSLSQLSPGEKGGLLLVFYLVLDKDNKPLIIDQPEDNLDNQSVAEILVPYIKRAKTKRQIIMVTHNPNLAIVADAEQIIYMNIDKENNYAVSSYSGGIENPIINKHIVNILEGKMKAFNNRRIKYKR